LAVLVALLGAAPLSPARANDLSPLSDEFNNPFTLPLWQRVHVVEGWGADHLEAIDISGARAGWLTLMPDLHLIRTGADPWRSPVGGDFVVTSAVENTARDGVSLPGINFSLGGLMIRTPRNITPATWAPGGENYVFLSVGYGQAGPPRWQFEVKTTVASQSTLILSDAPGPAARLQIARLGRYVICRAASRRAVARLHRYDRPDFPDTLQVGPVAYRLEQGADVRSSAQQGGVTAAAPVPISPSTPFYPDLIARWDYVLLGRLPAPLAGST
jgi:hypothetical protein